MRVPSVLSVRSAAISSDVLRLSLLAALLVVEFLALSLLIDTGKLSVAPWLHEALGFAPLIANLVVATAAGVTIFYGESWRGNFASWLTPPTYWPFALVGHLLCLSLFVALSLLVTQPDHSPAAWIVAIWLLSGIALGALWACAALTLPTWWRLFISVGPTLAICLLLAGAAVLMGGFARLLWEPLGAVVLTMVVWLVSPFGQTVVDYGTMDVGLNDFVVRIAPACSGFEGLALVTAFVTGFLILERRHLRFPQALVLLPLGLICIWLTNVARIAGLILLGAHYSSEVALGAFHSQAGWIAFNVVALGLIAWTGRSSFVSKRPARDSQTASLPNPALPYLAPFAAFMAAALVTNALSHGPSFWYAGRVLAALAVLLAFRQTYLSLRWRISWQGVALGALAFVIWIVLIPHDPYASEQIVAQYAELTDMQRYLILGARCLGYIIIAPLVEELAFRAYLTRRLLSSDFEQIPLGTFGWFPLVASSLLFGVAHGGFWLPAALAGLLYGVALYRRQSLGDAVAAHATTNALIVVYVALTGEWSVWG
ncbi:MAG TPA: exosortase E/protease, VPEID-CTERM system [Pirellulaceae bacterium]|nr:exosortase E/protease, VPEID-CTERM system [Pirellulaceae bacterium]